MRSWGSSCSSNQGIYNELEKSYQPPTHRSQPVAALQHLLVHLELTSSQTLAISEVKATIMMMEKTTIVTGMIMSDSTCPL